MRRKILIALLALGTLGGYGAGILSVGCSLRAHHAARTASLERHVADVCLEAAAGRK